MRMILQFVEIDGGGFNIECGHRRLFRFRGDIDVAKDQPVGTDAHDIVLRECHRNIDDLLVHEGSICRLQISENRLAAHVDYHLSMESRNTSRRVFENNIVVVAASDPDERERAVEDEIGAVGAIDEEAAVRHWRSASCSHVEEVYDGWSVASESGGPAF